LSPRPRERDAIADVDVRANEHYIVNLDISHPM